MNENKQVTLESSIPNYRSHTQHSWGFSGFRSIATEKSLFRDIHSVSRCL